MKNNISINPEHVVIMAYCHDSEKILIETVAKTIEVKNKSLEYFELLIKNIKNGNMINIDVNEILHASASEYKYEKYIVIFKKYISTIEYDEFNEQVKIITIIGEAVLYGNSHDDYIEILKEINATGMLLEKIPKKVNAKIEIPDFSKIKKL